MNENELAAKVQAVEADGRVRFGEKNWQTYCSAIGKAAGGNPGLGNAMIEVLRQPDPAAVIAQSGKEAMIALADQGDDEADRTYAKIREAERHEWRVAKGRVR